jgi:hypothetical protein
VSDADALRILKERRSAIHGRLSPRVREFLEAARRIADHNREAAAGRKPLLDVRAACGLSVYAAALVTAVADAFANGDADFFRKIANRLELKGDPLAPAQPIGEVLTRLILSERIDRTRPYGVKELQRLIKSCSRGRHPDPRVTSRVAKRLGITVLTPDEARRNLAKSQ